MRSGGHDVWPEEYLDRAAGAAARWSRHCVRERYGTLGSVLFGSPRFAVNERHGNHWASLNGGPGLTIGLHPSTQEVPAGRGGSIALGLYVDEPIADVMAKLTSRGVVFAGPVINDKALSLAFFSDPNGNPLYLAELKPACR